MIEVELALTSDLAKLLLRLPQCVRRYSLSEYPLFLMAKLVDRLGCS